MAAHSFLLIFAAELAVLVVQEEMESDNMDLVSTLQFCSLGHASFSTQAQASDLMRI